MTKSLPRDGYAGFFTGLSLQLWREAIPPAQTKAEVEFLDDVLGADEPGSRFLDVPCGNGRHARPLAARGYEITAVDLSPDFLEEGKRLAGEQGVADKITWVQQDMALLDFEDAFEGAYCLGNSFGYRDYEGMMTYLGAVARALRPGGRLVLDNAMSAESLLPNLEDKVWDRVGEDFVLLGENSYDPMESRLDTRFTILRNGQEEVHQVSHWVFTTAEMQRMLASVGMKTLALLNSVQGDPFNLRDLEVVIVAEKSD